MKRLFIALSLMLASVSAFAQIPFEVLEGGNASVSSSSINFIGRTDPSVKAVVAGEAVKVYKTGTFGKKITLNPGENTISVVLTKGHDTVTKEIKVTYTKPSSSSSSSSSSTSTEVKEFDMYAKTVQGAYFQNGNGDDRLGGSKMGYLEPDILLHITGEIGDLYRAQISDNRFAYVEKQYVKVCEGKLTKVNTGNVSISNAGKSDRISIPLGVRLPYTSWTELDPTTICVNIYGAMNNSNWLIHKQNLEMVDYVDMVQTDSDVVTVKIALKKKYAWGYSITYQNNNLVITVKHTPSTSLKDLTIGLDAGHGGTAPGAVSITGLTESELNLKLVNLVMDMLQAKGAKIVRTRTSVDQTLSMTERKKTLRDADVDFLVSIHNNAGGSPFVPMGTSVYYKHLVNRPFAQCIYNRMLELGVPDYGLTGNFNFSLCGPTDYPNILVEALFMSSLVDEEMLADENMQKQIAKKIVLGIQDYLKMVKREDSKKKQ
ncbi:MAG: N-acetylmuramoyl-L-alanine amidase [Bacteroidales bacterium]|nr:N-acetylmuramoyl-L-alanine amidase [Bacteroidales bacterium]